MPLIALSPVFVSLFAVAIGAALVSTGNGVMANIVPLQLKLQGASELATGVVAAGYTVGFLIGSIIAPRMIRTLGHARCFVAAAGLSVAITLAFPLTVHWIPWALLRVGGGITLAACFLVVESWINDQAPPERRGRVFSIYIMSNRLSYGVGQMLLVTGDPTGAGLFMVVGALLGLCLVPIAVHRGESPTPPERRGMSLLRLFNVSPLATVGCITAGLVNAAVNNLGAVYGVGVGMDVTRIAVFTAAVQVGNVLLQYPLGRWSDAGDRRKVLLAVCIVATVVCAVLGVFHDLPFAAMVALAALLGGMTLCIYPVCMSYAADRAERSQMVAVSGGMMLSWACGAAVGPFFAGVAMRLLGPGGLFLYGALCIGLLTVYCVWRMYRRPPPMRRVMTPRPPESKT
jgi:MFS family permease